MKKTNHQLLKIRAIILFLLALTFLNSCKTKVDFENADPKALEEYNEAVASLESSGDGHSLINPSAAPGDLWKSWEASFFACYKDETFRTNLVYLGPSNLRYLGTILSKNKQQTKRELTYILPPSEFVRFASKGAKVQECDLTRIKVLSIDAFLNADVLNKEDTAFQAAIKNRDSVVVTGGEWQIDELRIDDFKDYINESSDSKIKNYKKSLLDKNNLVITKVVKVNGFTADIYSTKGFNANLQANLQKPGGVAMAVATPDSTNKNLSFGLNFSSTKDKVVKVTSTGEFYIFAMALKGKKL